MKQVVGLAATLAAFWLLLSGHYTPLFLAFGAVSVALVTVVAARSGLADEEGRPLELLLRVPLYWAWLLLQIFASAFNVVRIIWSRKPVHPGFGSVPAAALTPLARVTYANSITLTPGTLSVAVHDDEIEVHALNPDSLKELQRGEMLDRVRRLEQH